MDKRLNIDIVVADNFFKKLIGLMFKKNKINYGLLFINCNSIHTFFMFQNIDIIMMDKNYKVLYLEKDLKPWRIILPKKDVFYVLETPKNFISFNKIELNDVYVLNTNKLTYY